VLRTPVFALGTARRAHWTTFVLRTPVFALGTARRAHWTTFVLRTPVFALGTARRAHATVPAKCYSRYALESLPPGNPHLVKPHLPRKRSTRAGNRRPRVWIAWCALVALVWSSVGILPSIGLEIASRQHAAAHRHDHGHAEGVIEAHAHHAHGDGHHAHDAQGDFSDIPGSPTHPLDHDCDQCQVLTHLSRCIFDAPCASTLDVVPGLPVRPNIAVVARAARDVADVPPARGPPFPLA